MRKLKLSKKQTTAGIITVSVLIVFVGAFALLSNISQLRSDVTRLQGALDTQSKQLQDARNEILSINANNGTALQVCLDNAAKAYGNSLKSTGTISQKPDGSTESVHDFDTWTKINDKLSADRKTCNAKYPQ